METKEPFDLETFLPYRLAQSAEAISLEFYQLYRSAYGMTRPEWRVMAHLAQYGEMTARDICNQAGLHKTKVSRAVRKLSDRGWLRRKEIAHDRRFEVLALTKPGLRIHDAIAKEGAGYNQRLRERLGARNAAQLLKLLEQLGAPDVKLSRRPKPEY